MSQTLSKLPFINLAVWIFFLLLVCQCGNKVELDKLDGFWAMTERRTSSDGLLLKKSAALIIEIHESEVQTIVDSPHAIEDDPIKVFSPRSAFTLVSAPNGLAFEKNASVFEIQTLNEQTLRLRTQMAASWVEYGFERLQKEEAVSLTDARTLAP